jgi:hypothetical protein
MKKYLIFITNWNKLTSHIRIRILKLTISVVFTIFFILLCAKSFFRI